MDCFGPNPAGGFIHSRNMLRLRCSHECTHRLHALRPQFQNEGISRSPKFPAPLRTQTRYGIEAEDCWFTFGSLPRTWRACLQAPRSTDHSRGKVVSFAPLDRLVAGFTGCELALSSFVQHVFHTPQQTVEICSWIHGPNAHDKACVKTANVTLRENRLVTSAPEKPRLRRDCSFSIAISCNPARCKIGTRKISLKLSILPQVPLAQIAPSTSRALSPPR